MQLGLLDHLLTLAGPKDGAELLLRLDQDLTALLASIEDCLARDDRKSLGAALHVLAGISGSVGADQLLADARLLGQTARDSTPLSPATAGQISAGIAFLLDAVQQRRLLRGAPA